MLARFQWRSYRWQVAGFTFLLGMTQKTHSVLVEPYMTMRHAEIVTTECH